MKTADAANVDSAVKTVLGAILDHGRTITAASTGLSVGVSQTTSELLAHQFVVADPADRLVFNSGLPFNLPLALARFIWLIGGNDRLADIQFYTHKVAHFTDDGIVVPGSSYGRRMRYPRPGLDQLDSCIDALRKDPASRRAAISIFFPEDADRESRDIPCAFGMFFHLRDDALVMTNLMRSNNAFLLLPFNLFEFSMVAEAVAAALGKPLGPMIYFTASMHLYEKDWAAAEKARQITAPEGMLRMPAMPRRPDILKQIAVLVRKEARLRERAGGLHLRSDVAKLCDEAGSPEKLVLNEEEVQLDPYFQQLYFILILKVIQSKQDLYGAHEDVKARLDPIYREYLGSSLDIPHQDEPLFSALADDEAKGEDVGLNDPVVVPIFNAIGQAEAQLGRHIPPGDYPRILAHFRPDMLELAARLETDPGARFDPQKIVDFVR